MANPRHLLGIEGRSREELLALLERAKACKAVLLQPSKKVGTLRGKVVVNLFFEASTRTRTSFEIAAKVLAADAVNWSSAGSSTSKGETLFDTVKNLEAMHPDAMVIRHAASGAAALVAQRVRCPVINAGDGAHEHPTQALLDAFTLQERWGSLQGRTVAIVGDIAHSRVARSDVLCLGALGAKVRVCGPTTLLPRGVEALGCSATSKLEEALAGVDAVIMLRIQTERLGDVRFPTTREYSKLFGLGSRSVRWLPEHALVLHPGPINRGVELAPEVADGPRSVILDQVENGVAVRMAVLHQLIAPEAPLA
jgi:aspartate carbamoyltransferase catalytic subunit